MNSEKSRCVVFRALHTEIRADKEGRATKVFIASALATDLVGKKDMIYGKIVADGSRVVDYETFFYRKAIEEQFPVLVYRHTDIEIELTAQGKEKGSQGDELTT